MSISVRFCDFWPGFDPHSNLFLSVISGSNSGRVNVVTSHHEKVDLEIVSVFCNKSLPRQAMLKFGSLASDSMKWDYLARSGRGFRLEYKTKARRRIWYTGENRRPPFGEFDATISFDPTDVVSNNVFFPYWMYRLDWGFDLYEFEQSPRPESLMEGRAYINRNRKACSFSSLRETNRERILKSVQKIFPVDVFGSAYRKPVTSKVSTSEDYAFQICTENDLYPNYVTEKLQESWICRNIPIWSGLDNESFFNREAFIDVTFSSLESIQEKLMAISQDQIEYLQTRPLLQKAPSIEEFQELILNQLN